MKRSNLFIIVDDLGKGRFLTLGKNGNAVGFFDRPYGFLFHGKRKALKFLSLFGPLFPEECSIKNIKIVEAPLFLTVIKYKHKKTGFFYKTSLTLSETRGRTQIIFPTTVIQNCLAPDFAENFAPVTVGIVKITKTPGFYLWGEK